MDSATTHALKEKLESFLEDIKLGTPNKELEECLGEIIKDFFDGRTFLSQQIGESDLKSTSEKDVDMDLDLEIQSVSSSSKPKKDIEETFLASLKEEKVKSFKNEEIKCSNTEECLTSIKMLDLKILKLNRTQLKYYALLGKVLKELKETEKNFIKLLNGIGITYRKQHINFLIKFNLLMDKYSIIETSILPLRFFKNNMVKIEEICLRNYI